MTFNVSYTSQEIRIWLISLQWMYMNESLQWKPLKRPFSVFVWLNSFEITRFFVISAQPAASADAL